jgi:hypothetical protein
MPDLHKIPVYEGMSIQDAWGHITDAGLGNAVPEFVREAALGRGWVWVNVVAVDEKVERAWWPDGTEVAADMLDEPVCREEQPGS